MFKVSKRYKLKDGSKVISFNIDSDQDIDFNSSGPENVIVIHPITTVVIGLFMLGILIHLILYYLNPSASIIKGVGFHILWMIINIIGTVVSILNIKKEYTKTSKTSWFDFYAQNQKKFMSGIIFWIMMILAAMFPIYSTIGLMFAILALIAIIEPTSNILSNAFTFKADKIIRVVDRLEAKYSHKPEISNNESTDSEKPSD